MRKGWAETTLGDIAEVVGGGTPSTSKEDFWNGDVIWLTPTEVTALDGKVISDSKRKITQAGLQSSGARILPRGTVILTSRASVGFVALAGTELTTNQGFQSLIPSELVDGVFLMFWIQMNRSEFESRSAGSTFKEISKSNVKSIAMNLPPLHLQRRIVDVVSSVDSYIDALQQHAETARIARNAVLNELLSAGGDDWTESTLGDIAQWQGGITPSMANNEFWENGTIPWVSSGDVLQLNLRGAQKFVTEISLKETSLKLLPVGTVVVVVRSGILIHTLPIAILESPSTINQDIKAGVPRSDVLGQFLLWALRSNSRVILESCRKTGTTVQSISTDAFLKFPVLLPPLDEQKRIVEIVSFMDEVIQSTEQAVVDAKNLRSGLLSDLLSGEHEIPASYDSLLGAA